MPEKRPLSNVGVSSGDALRWTRVQDLFHAATELPEHQRQAFIETECGAETSLRDEVLSLLESDQKANSFIEQPAAVLLGKSQCGPTTPRLAPGDTLGRYEILAFLGAGGSSEVYRARDSRLGREVAVKLVTDPHDPDAGPRLLREAQHASILNHPNICAVYEADAGEELPFITLEFVEGPTLHDVLRERRVTLSEALRWAEDIAAALDHAHRRGIIHRDLKSANIALTHDGNVKILDFGLARRLGGDPAGRSTAAIWHDASVAGTLTHIAPEVLSRQPFDHRIDVWALGVLLYEMVGGRLPFKGSTPIETVRAVLEAAPAPLSSTVPSAVRQLIERCLEKDPARRLNTAAVREALRALGLEGARQRSHWRTAAIAAVATVAILMAWLATRPPLPATAPRVIAISPFDDTGDRSESYVTTGTTEALVSELGRIDGIRVLAAGSLARETDAAARRERAREIGASHLLEGALSKTDTDVRLMVELVETSTGQAVWSSTYRRGLREVQTLYAAVAADVAAQVHVDVGEEDARYFGAVRAVDPEVYEAYLKGRYHWNQRTPESVRTAVSYFETALRLDPTYAPAYAAVADAYNQLATVLVNGGPPQQWRPKAADAAIKALQIDPQLAEAHATLGYVWHYDWKWQDAEAAFRRAIRLNPSYSMARIWYANLLCSQRRFDEAIREVTIARDLDPLSLIVSTNVGWVFFRARRNHEAITEYQRALTLDANYLQAHLRLMDAYVRAGRFDDAIVESEAVVRLSKGSLPHLVLLEQVKKLAGRDNEFDLRLDELLQHAADSYVSPGTIANAYFAVGRNDEGFRWLERAYRERTNNMAYLAVEPVYDRVREDPRFTALTRAVGVP